MSGRDFGSLTKEPPLKNLDDTILAIVPEMRYEALLEFSRRNTHATAPGLIRKRFVQVRDDGTIAYDRFLSLVSLHGIENPLVRKVMLFVWAYRDMRLRRFICERVADKTGKWRAGELRRLSNAEFFETEGWLGSGAARKARSNIEFFLKETSIFETAPGRIHLELEDGWLHEAAAVAAQHEDNPLERRRLLENVAQFLIEKKWTGLANATEADLATIGANPVEDVVPREDETTTTENAKPYPTREWNRRRPKQNDKKSTSVLIDLVARERANQSHFVLEQIAAELIQARGLMPRHNEHIDMYFESPHGIVLIEMKSCDDGNVQSQVRKGISQLFEYRYIYKKALGDRPALMLLIEAAPPPGKTWLVEYLQTIGIILAWKLPRMRRIASTCTLPQALAGIVAQQLA